jgi:putative transposase
MSRKRYTEEQIIGVLKTADQGMTTAEVCRQHNISSATLYKWKSKFGGMEVSDARRLKALEDENRKLKTLVADLTLDNQALRALSSKNFLSPK